MKKNFNSTKNIQKIRNKSHNIINKIINNINNKSKENQMLYTINIERPKTNYNNYRANIYLYHNYKSYKKQNHTINIDYSITRPNFFINKNTHNIINIKKNNNYYKSNTIDFNSNYHLIQTPTLSRIENKSSKRIKNCFNLKKSNKIIDDINKILYFNYGNNKEQNQIYKNNYNNIFSKDISINKNRLNKNYNSINVIRTKTDFNKRKIKLKNEKKFLNEMIKIYNKYNGIKKGSDNYDYKKIILWINDLINKKEIKEIKSNKYENFCKQLMKENNINDFSSFQSFAKNNINEEKNINFFIKDIKNILFKEFT